MVFPAMDIDCGNLRYEAWLLPPRLKEHNVLCSPKHAPQFEGSTTRLAMKRAPTNEDLPGWPGPASV
eukprot:1575925-Prorocentrum_lima.AAC.1